MADFGELCPLFNTGVFNEITFPNINGGTNLYSATLTYNLLEGSGCKGGISIIAGAGLTMFTFGRTVVITAGWVQRQLTNKTAQHLKFLHKTTQSAAGTEFATVSIVATISVQTRNAMKEMTVTAKTFTSSEVLGLRIGTITADTIGSYSVTFRYKEK